MAQKKIIQTAGRDQLGEFAPKFAALNDDVLFGEVWSRTDKLGLRDRSLVTIIAYQPRHYGQFADLSFAVGEKQRHHPHRNRRNHHAYRFYAGWPKAWAAFRLAKRRMGSGGKR